jgi:phasin family protein
MSTFNERLQPAAEAHVNAQFSFLDDMARTLLQSFQKISDLNLNLTQSFVEESTRLGRDLAAADKPTAVLSATAAQAAPAGERLRQYKDNLARISAEAQAELSRCAERHVPETSRTAQTLAEEFMKAGAEESQKAQQAMLRQQEALQREAQRMAQNAADAQRRTGEALRANPASGSAADEPEEAQQQSASRQTPRQNGAEAAAREDGKKPGAQGRRT